MYLSSSLRTWGVASACLCSPAPGKPHFGDAPFDLHVCEFNNATLVVLFSLQYTTAEHNLRSYARTRTRTRARTRVYSAFTWSLFGVVAVAMHNNGSPIRKTNCKNCNHLFLHSASFHLFCFVFFVCRRSRLQKERSAAVGAADDQLRTRCPLFRARSRRRVPGDRLRRHLVRFVSSLHLTCHLLLPLLDCFCFGFSRQSIRRFTCLELLVQILYYAQLLYCFHFWRAAWFLYLYCFEKN